MRSRFLALFCIFILMFSLCGCGNSYKEAISNGTGFDINTSVSMEDGFVSDYIDFEEAIVEDFNEVDGFISKGYSEYEDFNTEEYNTIKENSFELVNITPLSTFAADVDTGSYTNLRRMIMRENCGIEDIPSGAIRTEELLNYFDYTVENKSDGKFSVQYETNTCPWNTSNDLLLLTVEANEVDIENKGNNFVYLIDTSGSMDSIDKLELAVESFMLLTENLTKDDRVSIVTYAGESNVLLDGCPGNEYKKIVKALGRLNASGGTNGSGGIEGAYDCALDNYIVGGNNRVIIASDGDMNLGLTSQSDLVDLISEKKESGIFLTTLGFGTGNYSDANMEQIADAGNGNYYYIDSIEEAERVLVDKLMQTTVTVAKDVKFQVEFNPSVVAEYRLLGYENRTLSANDFEDDTKDGGEVGAGQQVTVLYELSYDGTNDGKTLKYQENKVKGNSDELCTLSVRYKEPKETKSSLEEYPITKTSGEPSKDWKLAASIAELSMILRDSDYVGTVTLEEAMTLASDSCTDMYRTQYVGMLGLLGVDPMYTYEEKEQIYDKDIQEDNSTTILINLGTLDSTEFKDNFEYKTQCNIVLEDLLEQGFNIQDNNIIENDNDSFTVEIILKDYNNSDLSMILDSFYEYGFVNITVEENLY